MTIKSATVAINSLAQHKMLSGIKVHNLSTGEPCLPPHKLLIDATTHALNEGKTLYPPVSGIHELRDLASVWMNKKYHSDFTFKNTLVTNGGKLGIYLLAQHLLKPDDEVIIVSPYWVSYPAITKLFGGDPIIIETTESEGWKLSPDKLKKACSRKTKILMLNNASNPTGMLYSKQDLENILAIAKANNILVISDEVYSDLTYDSNHYISCAAFPDYKDNVVVIQSCSKNFAMTGWRVGFVFANETLIESLSALLSQCTSGVTTLSQWAAIAAFKHSAEITDWVKQEMQKRRDVIVDAFRTYFGIEITSPSSSLYIFISLDTLGVKNISSSEYCMQLLEKSNVALVPGSAFGKEGYVRLSFGGLPDDLIAAIKSMATFSRRE